MRGIETSNGSNGSNGADPGRRPHAGRAARARREAGKAAPAVFAGLMGTLLLAGAIGFLFLGGDSPDRIAAAGDVAAAKVDAHAEEARVEIAKTAADAEREETEADAPIEPEPEAEAEEDAIPPDATGVTGRVIGADGKPAPGIEVRLVASVEAKDAERFGVKIQPGKSNERYALSAVTDEDGSFTIIDAVPFDRYQLMAKSSSGLLGNRWGIEILEKNLLDVGDFAVRKGARVRGTVRTEAGLQLSNAEVEFGWGWNSEPVKTDAKGRFDAGVLFPGQQQVRVELPGYALKDSVQREFVEGDDIDDFEILMVEASTLRGRVHDESGRPIEDAQVWANREKDEDSWGSWYGADTRSRADGTFEFPSLSPGNYSVQVSANGYRSFWKGGVAAGSNPMDVELKKSCSISGLIVNAQTGAAVKAEKIKLLWIPPWEREDRNAELQECWNDAKVDIRDDGSFQVAMEEPGTYAVEVSAKEYATARSERHEIAENGTVTGVIVRLEPGIGLDVTVLDQADDKPVAGAIVEVFTLVRNEEAASRFQQISGLGYGGSNLPSQYGDPGDRLAKVPTDADGRAHVTGLPPGMFITFASKRGYARARVNDIEITRGAQPAPIQIKLGLGGAIEGKVTNEQNEPEPAIRVFAYGNAGGNGEAVTLEGGAYKIEHLAPGRYRVEPRPEGGMYNLDKNRYRNREEGRELTLLEKFPILVEDGKTAKQDLTVDRIIPGSLKGTVLINGRPAAGLTVFAQWVDPNQRNRNRYWGGNQAKTDDQGNFNFRRLKPGTYGLQVMKSWRANYTAGDVVVNPGVEGQAFIDIGLGAIEGIVLDETGKAIPGANVSLQRDNTWFGGSNVSSDAQGRFRIEDVQAGVVDVQIRAQGFRPGKAEAVQVPARGISQLVELRLKAGGWIKVKVLGLVKGPNRWPYLKAEFTDTGGKKLFGTWVQPPSGDDPVYWIEHATGRAGTLVLTQPENDNGAQGLAATAQVAELGDKVAELTMSFGN